MIDETRESLISKIFSKCAQFAWGEFSSTFSSKAMAVFGPKSEHFVAHCAFCVDGNSFGKANNIQGDGKPWPELNILTLVGPLRIICKKNWISCKHQRSLVKINLIQ